MEYERILMFLEDDLVVVEDGSAAEEDGEVATVGDEDLDVGVGVLAVVTVDRHGDVGAAQRCFAARGVDAACFRELEFEELGDGVGDDDEVPAAVEERIDERGDAVPSMELDRDEGVVVVFEDQRIVVHSAR